MSVDRHQREKARREKALRDQYLMPPPPLFGRDVRRNRDIDSTMKIDGNSQECDPGRFNVPGSPNGKSPYRQAPTPSRTPLHSPGNIPTTKKPNGDSSYCHAWTASRTSLHGLLKYPQQSPNPAIHPPGRSLKEIQDAFREMELNEEGMPWIDMAVGDVFSSAKG